MRKLISIVLIFIMCSVCICSYAENNISELQDKQKEIQTQIQQSGQELTDVQDELSDNLQQLQILDEKIEKSEEELESLKKKIEELNITIKKQEEGLNEATKKYQKQKSIADARLIAMYETGETEYLDVMLSASDLSEFISSYAVLTEIAAYDKDILDSVEEQKTIKEMVNERLTENLSRLSYLQKNEETNTKMLQNTKKVREKYLEQLSEHEKQVQGEIDEYKAKFREVNKEILEIAGTQGLSAEYIGGEMAWPVPGYTRISSNYGMRTHPITGVYKLHTGVDIAAPAGANFVAANDGIVTKAYYNGAYGNMVLIDHGGGISTLYAHGSQILVQVGQAVSRGEPILKVGSTGYSTGPHAHFEVRINGVVTDPMEYITKGKIPGNTNNGTTNNTTNEQAKNETTVDTTSEQTKNEIASNTTNERTKNETVSNTTNEQAKNEIAGNTTN